MPPKSHYRPEGPDRNLSSTSTHATSLSESELSLVHRLCLFSVAWPQLIHDEELKRQLYRFGYAINPPDGLKWPRKWYNSASLPTGSLAETMTTVRELLDRPDALKRLPPPTPAPITNGQTQSPLFSKIPPKIRNRISELVVVSEDTIDVPVDRVWGSNVRPPTKEEIRKSLPPSITRVCRQVRAETLPMFMEMNDFLFNTNFMDATGPPEKWLNIMRPHLSSMNSLTFLLTTWVELSRKNVIVNIGHNKAHNSWDITSMDDWSDEHPAHQWALKYDSDLLWHLMAYMMDQRSRADLTPEYLLWLIKDLKYIYYHAKTSPFHPARNYYEDRRSNWFQEHALGRLPDVARPPDMYTTDVDEQFLGKKL
jgi:hypothetical protein